MWVRALYLDCEAADLNLRAGLVHSDGRAATGAVYLLLIEEASSGRPLEDEVSRRGGCHGQCEEGLRQHVGER